MLISANDDMTKYTFTHTKVQTYRTSNTPEDNLDFCRYVFNLTPDQIQQLKTTGEVVTGEGVVRLVVLDQDLQQVETRIKTLLEGAHQDPQEPIEGAVDLG